MLSDRRRWAIPLVVAVALAVLLPALVTLDARAGIPRGVQVDGVDVGGSSPGAAERAVAAHAAEKAGEPILLVGPGTTTYEWGCARARPAWPKRLLRQASNGSASRVPAHVSGLHHVQRGELFEPATRW